MKKSNEHNISSEAFTKFEPKNDKLDTSTDRTGKYRIVWFGFKI